MSCFRTASYLEVALQACAVSRAKQKHPRFAHSACAGFLAASLEPFLFEFCSWAVAANVGTKTVQVSVISVSRVAAGICPYWTGVGQAGGLPGWILIDCFECFHLRSYCNASRMQQIHSCTSQSGGATWRCCLPWALCTTKQDACAFLKVPEVQSQVGYTRTTSGDPVHSTAFAAQQSMARGQVRFVVS